MAADTVRIRTATGAEAGELTELAMRSRAHRGYSDRFMRSYRLLCTVSSAYIDRKPTCVAGGSRRPERERDAVIMAAGWTTHGPWIITLTPGTHTLMLSGQRV